MSDFVPVIYPSIFLPDESAYIQKVLSYSPIGYWPINELSGTVINNLAGAAPVSDRNGVSSGVTLNQVVGPLGVARAPRWDGINDDGSLNTVSLANLFDGEEGTILLWHVVFAATVWTDATLRHLFNIESGTHQIRIGTDGGGGLSYLYSTVGSVAHTHSTTTTAWFAAMMTWSRTNNQVIRYFDGVQTGATVAMPAASWTAGLPNAWLGARFSGGGGVANGYLGHVCLWNTPLSAAAALDLGNKGF